MAKVSIHRSTSQPMAQCESCDRLPSNATRERVRQHVKQTGHTAWVVVEDQTRYSPKEDREADQ